MINYKALSQLSSGFLKTVFGVIAAITFVVCAYAAGNWLIDKWEQWMLPHPEYVELVGELRSATPGDLVVWKNGHMRKLGDSHTLFGYLRMWRCGWQANLNLSHAPSLEGIDKIIRRSSPEFKKYRAEYIADCMY